MSLTTIPVNVRGGGTWATVRTLRVEVVGEDEKATHPSAEGETVTVGTAPGNDLELTDPTVSRFHLELSALPGGVLVVDRGSTNATMMGNVRIERAFVPPGTVLRLGRSTIKVLDGKDAVVEIPNVDNVAGLVGGTLAMRRLFGQVTKLSKTNAAVLIQGESGTGKELVARALHDLGTRLGKPFITVDCGALTPSLVASELFGHEKGAFTGAEKRHVGAFERAHGGTIFLDEIGEMPLSLQTTLLGVIERRRFRRLGGTSEIALDVRILSATNRDLRTSVNAGLFRMDLYYRIAVVSLSMPSLRERLDDIPLLVGHFLRECGHSKPLEEVFSPDVLKELRSHTWPGNVRELRNLVEATLATGDLPDPQKLAPADRAEGDQLFNSVLGLEYKRARSAILTEFESRYLKHILAAAKGNVAKAAREAKMDRSYLIELLKRHGLEGE